MKCVISGVNIKVFAKAIQSLAKIGPELFFDGTKNGLSIRTVNSTKSAFGQIEFLPAFFCDYDTEEQDNDNNSSNKNNENDDFENTCKVSTKACLGAFKNMKTVERCTIIIDTKTTKFVIQLECKLDTVKTNSISILDTEFLEAFYVTDNVRNKIVATHKIFNDISNNFQMQEEEITIEAKTNNLVVKNYVEGSHIDRRFMRSQLTLESDEFLKYNVKEETSVTFCLKEFRAFLGFAEAINFDIALLFEECGKPIVFMFENSNAFDVTLVMSTLSPEDVTMCPNSTSTSNTLDANISINTGSVTTNQKKRVGSPEKETTTKRSRILEKSPTNMDDSNQKDSEVINLVNDDNDEEVPVKENTNSKQTRNSTSILNCNKLLNTKSIIKTSHLPAESTSPNGNRRNSTSVSNSLSGDIHITFRDTQEIEELKKLPNPKANKQIFKKCLEAPITLMERTDEILARSSDTED